MIGCGCGAQSPFTSVTSVTCCSGMSVSIYNFITCSSGRQVGLVVVVLVRVHLQVPVRAQAASEECSSQAFGESPEH